jgi:uncharacterized protein (DUF302 family)
LYKGKIKMKKLVRTLSSVLFLPLVMHAQSPDRPTVVSGTQPENLAVMYDLEGEDVEKRYTELVEKKLKEIGYTLTDPHYRVNDQYEKKYGSTQLDILSFLPVVNDNVVMPLLNIDPRLAGFSPFNMLIYKKKSENPYHVGHLTPEAILDILGITDATVREKYIASFKPLDALLDKEFGAAHKRMIPYHNTTPHKMINFEYTFERGEDFDIEDFKDEFQNKFELAFIAQSYLIAGYHDFFQTDDGEDVLKDYDAFWIYSLCHLGYSYQIFDNKGARPDAGLFAPCTMYVYVKKNANKMVIGMPALANVKNTLDIKDPKRRAWMERLDREIPQILASMGMKAVENINPLKTEPKPLAKQPLNHVTPPVETEAFNQAATKKKEKVQVKTNGASETAPVTETKPSGVQPKIQKIETDSEVIEITIPVPPKPPKPVTLKVNGSVSSNELGQNRTIKFSKRMPPNYIPGHHVNEPVGNSSSLIGDINSGRISAYLRGKYEDAQTVQEKLKAAGFEIIAAVPLDKKGTLISIVFTNKALQEMAAKPKKGFAASLRVLVDSKAKRISITNPLYITKGFLQKDFDKSKAKAELTKLNDHFKGLKNSDDALKFQLLPNYRFMKGMPTYNDMVEVAQGNDLLERAKANKKVLFEERLPNGATLIGVKLSKRAGKFPARIGTNNAALLPYPVLIENNKAYILDPKYYISVMYPKLKMSEFMTIATVPDAIIKDCERAFRKKKK